MPFINFANRGFTGPSTFVDAGSEQTLNLPYNITVSGGVILGNETNLAVEDASVYGTASPFGNVSPGPGLTNPVTITFPVPVTSFAIEIFNGYPDTVNYYVSDNSGDSTSVSLPPNNSSDATSIVLPMSGSATTFTIGTSNSPWDFSIDNLAFDFKPTDVQIPKTHSIKDNVSLGLSNAGAYYSVYAAFAAPETAGLSLLGEIIQYVTVAGNAVSGFAYLDPFDQNYKQEVLPVFQSLPAIESDSVITAGLASDANVALSDATKALAYMRAMYVSLNRFNSATQVGDQLSANLQNVAVDSYLSLSSYSLSEFSKDLTKLQSDFSATSTNTVVTESQIETFIDSIKSGGFSALPQNEQSWFNAGGFSVAEEQSIASNIESIDAAQVPLSMTDALKMEAGYIANLASIYGTVNNVDSSFLPPPTFTGFFEANEANGYGLSGTGGVGDTIVIYDGATSIASATVDETGTWTAPNLTLGAGFNALSASDSNASGDTSANSTTLAFSEGADTDSLTTNAGAFLVAGGTESILVQGSSSPLEFAGSAGAATIVAAGASVLFGGGGGGLFQGGTSQMVYVGETGASTVVGGTGGAQVWGEDANSVVFGGVGPLEFLGGTGAATVVAAASSSTLFGGQGSAQYWGGSGQMLFVGGTGPSTVTGGSGTSTLFGGSSGDLLVGGLGATTIVGGSGNDDIFAGQGGGLLYGGAGVDLFLFANGSGGGSDVIGDFTQGVDHATLLGYAPGTLQSVLDNSTVSEGSTTITLPDSTIVTFSGISNLTASDFVSFG